jgi:uncharacterized GH25 family protein
MARTTRTLALAGALAASDAAAHDLFLKPDSFAIAPGARARLTLLNGTFLHSENAVKRERLRDLSLVGPAGRTALDPVSWSDGGLATVFEALLPGPGTYVVAASTRPRELRLEGAAFNAYLKEEGIDGVLEARKASGELNKAARERYSKHVKVLLRAGEGGGDAWSVALGYPAEIVPAANPAGLKPGASLSLRCLVGGKAVAGIVVIAGHVGPDGKLVEQRATTASDGIATIRLSAAGAWFAKFIQMVRTSEPNLDYESTWATLTFGVQP